VTVLQRLDALIRDRSEGQKSLDDVLRTLVAEREPVTTESFLEQVEATTGLDLASFFRREVGPRP
jgi:predicted metalloprotease with PDZ domain